MSSAGECTEPKLKQSYLLLFTFNHVMRMHLHFLNKRDSHKHLTKVRDAEHKIDQKEKFLFAEESGKISQTWSKGLK